MKLLLAHNHYRSSSPSGEDIVFRNEKDLLSKHVEVVSYERFNDAIDESSLRSKANLAINGIWAKDTYEDISKIIETEKPDIAHFHNTFPQISASAYDACKRAGVPVVQTLHNYRLICSNALLLRENKICTRCITGNPLPAIFFRCYRKSLPASIAQAAAITSNRLRGTYTKNIDAYIALTQATSMIFGNGGIPADKITVKPNFLPTDPEIGLGRGGYFAYVGRLSVEKGLNTLLKAWRSLGDVPLKVVGDGELKTELQAMSRGSSSQIEFLGLCSPHRVMDIVGDATAIVVPSEWYEPFGLVVIEAFARGTPVIASRIGSLSEIVEHEVTGLHFTPGNEHELAEAVLRLQRDSGAAFAMRANARAKYLERYTEQANLMQLMSIYESVMGPMAS